MKPLFPIVLGLFLAVPAFSADKYFAATTAGGGTMADCAHALIYTDATNGLDSANAQAPGNRLHWCGTVTGGTNFRFMTLTHSGSAGNPITLVWETGAIVQAPYCSNLACIHGASVDYWTFDGGTNGILQGTDNGTSLTYQESSIGIQCNNCNHFIVQNLSILGIYVHTANVDEADLGSPDQTAAINGGGSDVLFTHNTLSDSMEEVSWGPTDNTNSSNWEVSFNVIKNCNRCVVMVCSEVTVDNVKIHDNEFPGSSTLWDSPTNHFHHNPIHLFGDNVTGKMNNVLVYNNWVHDWGGEHSTSALAFYEWLRADTPIYTFNNLVDFTGSGIGAFGANGTVALDNTGSNDNRLYNNTFIGINNGNYWGTVGGCDGGGTTHVTTRNNVVAYMTFLFGVCVVDSADYDVLTNGAEFQDGVYANFAAVQAAGYELHGFVATPGFDGSYVPSSSSNLYHVGADLSSFSITTLNTSKNGVSRGSGSPWTIGANDVPGSTPPPTVVGSGRSQFHR